MTYKRNIAHVLYRLDTGGMERVLVSVIRGSHEQFDHTVIALAGSGDMQWEIKPLGVRCISLQKKAGKDWGCYLRLYRSLRKLRPDLVQTYNLGCVDAVLIAKLAGVRHVLHAEHGRDSHDPQGKSRRYRALRRMMAPFIDRYVVVSRDLERWLISTIGIDKAKVCYLPNGVDVARFTAVSKTGQRPLLGGFAPPGALVIGTVGRLDPIKNQTALVSAFHQLCQIQSSTSHLLRLIIVGEGPERALLEKQVEDLGISDQVWLPGNREDVAELLRECDLFALSSQAEGMPVTILEAMAAGLPVVATAVGGIPEVVVNGVTGTLVPADDEQAFVDALADYIGNAAKRIAHGKAGADRVSAEFSLTTMLSGYSELYDSLLIHSVEHTQSKMPERMDNCHKEP